MKRHPIMKTLESLTAIDLVRKIDQDDIMTSQVALVLLLLAVCLCRLESSSRLESKRKKRHVPELPLVFLWEWGGSSKNSSRHITKESGSWSTMFDHQDEAKKLLRKCNGVTHRLTPLISKADTVLCAERTHGNSMDMNMKMLEEYHSTVKKHLVRGHGNSAGIVIGSKKTKREFGIHVTTIARRGLLIFGTEAINSDYSDYGSGPIQAMFVPIPYLASPVTSIDGDGKKKGGAKRQYMFSFIGTKNVSIWRNQRSMVMDVLQSRKDSIVHVPTGTRSNVTESEFDVYLDSNFCPSPGGDSRSSKRFFDAIVHGCIPVVCDKAFPLPFHSQTPILDVVQYLDCSSKDTISRGLDLLSSRVQYIRTKAEEAMEAVKQSYDYKQCFLMGHIMQEVKARQSLPLLFSSFEDKLKGGRPA